MATEDCPVCRNVRPESCQHCKGKGTVEAKNVSHDGDVKKYEAPTPSNIARP